MEPTHGRPDESRLWNHTDILLKALDQCEAIVRDLAADNPMDGEEYGCGICLTVLADEDMLRPEKHAEACTWRRAVEFVSAHPVSGTERS